MTTSHRKRHDRRRETTRIAIIEAAETMFAEGTVEAVSIRQIGAAIGSANPSVVGYHFGGKDALIEEIYRYRVPQLEARRAELLAEVEKSQSALNLETLMRVLWQPLFELTNESGQHTYARFLSSVFREGLAKTREMVNPEFPVTRGLVERIRALLPTNLGNAADRRWPLVTYIVLNALLLIDQELPGNGPDAEAFFYDAIAMATTALALDASRPAP
jgi:AcrR family transcriptional regulator